MYFAPALVITAMSIFNPALLPSSEDPLLSSYGNEDIKLLANFYGKEACVEHNERCFTSPPILNADELITEWALFRRAMIIKKKCLLRLKNLELAPSLQELFKEMNTSSTYSGIFPEMMKLLNIILNLPVGMATVEWPLSDMKMIKTRL